MADKDIKQLTKNGVPFYPKVSVDGIVDFPTDYAKQGDNPDATNTAILNAVNQGGGGMSPEQYDALAKENTLSGVANSVSREVGIFHNAVVGSLYVNFNEPNGLSHTKDSDEYTITSSPIQLKAGQTIFYYSPEHNAAHKIIRLPNRIYEDGAVIDIIAESDEGDDCYFEADDNCVICLCCEIGVSTKDVYEINSPTDVIDVAIATNRDVENIDKKVVDVENKLSELSTKVGEIQEYFNYIATDAEAEAYFNS